MTNKKTITLLTLNIHKGFSPRNRRHTLHQIKACIQETKADLVCLQEVVGYHSGHAQEAQFEVLADQIWSHHAYGKNAIYSEGHHGNAILSHFPFSSYENFNISTNRFERRGVLHGVMNVPALLDKPLHVMTAHLDLLSKGRRMQLERITKLIDQRVKGDEPLILCGDFNDWKEEASRYLKKQCDLDEAYFLKKGFHALTFPAQFPFLKLDRIYIRGLEVKNIVRLTGKPWNEISDHLGLIVELSF